MFQIVERYEDLVRALTEDGGVFIRVKTMSKIGSIVLADMDRVLRGLDACPPLEEKTMFPEALSYAPDAKRKVIQAFVAREPDLGDRVEPTVVTEARRSMAPLVKLMVPVAQTILEETVRVHNIEAPALLEKTEWSLVSMYYPFIAGGKGRVLFPAHKDWGTLAIYPSILGSGLEVAPDGKTYEPLVLPPDCMFCYAGDILGRLSPIKPLLHRVVQPDDSEAGRTSMIFYADPPRDMVLPGGTLVEDIINGKLRKIGQIPGGPK